MRSHDDISHSALRVDWFYDNQRIQSDGELSPVTRPVIDLGVICTRLRSGVASRGTGNSGLTRIQIRTTAVSARTAVPSYTYTDCTYIHVY